MRCASPSTIAVFPTPALPMSAGLFLLWRSRMSTTRAISASRQRTGSRSPRRACAVRSTPTRSSTSPVSNRPPSGSLTASAPPQKLQVPLDDRVARHERDACAHGEEYPERHETFALQGEGQKHDAASHGAEKHRERSEEHTSELQSRLHLVCRLLLEKKKKNTHAATAQRAIKNTTEHQL